MKKVLDTSWIVTLVTFDVLRIVFAVSFAWSLLVSILFGLKRRDVTEAFRNPAE